MTNLISNLDKKKCYCLNESPLNTFSNLFIGDHTLSLKSDADEQLLLHFELIQTCKLSSIQLQLPIDDSRPSVIKLFINVASIGFSEATNNKETQIFNVPAEGDVVTIQLLPLKWNRTNSISLFVTSNHGSDVSCMHSVKLFGTPINDTTDVSKIHTTK